MAEGASTFPELAWVVFDIFLKAQAIAMILSYLIDEIKPTILSLISIIIVYVVDYAAGANIVGSMLLGLFYEGLAPLFLLLILYVVTYGVAWQIRYILPKISIKSIDTIPSRLEIFVLILAVILFAGSCFTLSLYAYNENRKQKEIETQREREIIRQYSAVFSNGTGTKDDPFQVSNATELSAIHHLLSFHFIQTADIYFSDADFEDTGGFWEPIGTSQNIYKHFTGSYDGNGYGIYGLKLSADDTTRTYSVGMFGCTDGAVLKNISLERPIYKRSMEHKACVGFLAGSINESVVDNCRVNAEYLENVGTTGGLIGNTFGSRIVGCEVTITKMVVGGEFANVEPDSIDVNVIDGNIFGIIGSITQSYRDVKLPIDAEEGIFDCISNISVYEVIDE